MRTKAAFFCFPSQLGANPHPFFVTEIKELSTRFERAEVFCAQADCGFDDLKKYKNVKINAISRRRKYIAAPLIPLILLRKEVRQEIAAAVKKHKFSVRYLLTLFNYLCLAEVTLKNALKTLPELKTEPEKWLLYSYWMDFDSYVVSRLKARFPKTAAVTRVHAYEIDPLRNKFYDLLLKGYTASTLDRLCFISSQKKALFEDDIMPFYGGVRDGSTALYRLYAKDFGFINRPSNDGVFRVLTCARAEPVKRLGLVARSLAFWDGPPIIWTHIGSGSELSKIKALASVIKNPLVTADFKGGISGGAVREFYRRNPVDLLLNVSFSEGVPVTFMEAMSCGVPVMATDAGGSGEIVNCENGVLIPIDTRPQDLCALLKRFALMPAAEKMKMRGLAAETYKNGFDISKNAEVFFDMCKGIV